jgi:glycosyltransferase involved in cell wall biosynthesis
VFWNWCWAKAFSRFSEWRTRKPIAKGRDNAQARQTGTRFNDLTSLPQSRRVFLAAVGDANDPGTWSGIPYHFLQAGKAAGLIDQGLALSTEGLPWRLRRWTWNLREVLRGSGHGGYQYSPQFLERLWRPHVKRLKGNSVINCFQLYPPSVVADDSIEKSFYIDMTLRQLFDYYGGGCGVGARIRADAIRREQEGYHSAGGVLTHSGWAAASVIQDYAVPADRVHAVVPGANIDPIERLRWEDEHGGNKGAPDFRSLRLVFVGKDWRRKGLDRILGAFGAARRAGLNATLRVIGCLPRSLPAQYRSMEGVEWLGFVDKQTDAVRFLRSVAECDIGCLLSRAEAGGMALREYHALGLVTIGPDTGGAPEHMIEGASLAVSPVATEPEIAGLLLQLDRDRAWLNRLRANAWNSRHLALWENSVRQMLSFWPDRRDGLGILHAGTLGSKGTHARNCEAGLE